MAVSVRYYAIKIGLLTHFSSLWCVLMQAKAERIASLPQFLPPLGVGGLKAAALFDTSPNLFDRFVQNGQLPQPSLLGRDWDRISLSLVKHGVRCRICTKILTR